MITTSVSFLRRNLWLAAATLGLAVFAFVWLAMPHERTINSFWEVAVKFLAFLCISLSIAFFPNKGRAWYLLLYVAFIGFTGYIIPRISYFYYWFTDHSHADDFYTHLYLLLYPGAVLAVAAAYRLGGGTPGRCVKIAVTGMLILFSGFLDVMWQLVNPVPIPAKIEAPHIMMITGRALSFGGTVLFTLAHLPLIAGINLLPLDRWFSRLQGEPARD